METRATIRPASDSSGTSGYEDRRQGREHEEGQLQRDHHEQHEGHGVPGLVGEHVRRLRQLAGCGDEEHRGPNEVRGEMYGAGWRVALAEASARLDGSAGHQGRGDEGSERKVRSGRQRKKWPDTGYERGPAHRDLDDPEAADK